MYGAIFGRVVQLGMAAVLAAAGFLLNATGFDVDRSSPCCSSPTTERYDPMRFIDPAPQEPFAFIPFGKGSHMCLGMHFAAMDVKAVLYRLLLSREVRFADCGNRALNYVLIVRPLEPVRLHFGPSTRTTP